MVAAIPFQPMNDGFGTYTTKAGGTIAVGSFVVLGTDGVAAAADACTTGICGIARNAAVDGGLVNVSTSGVWILDLATDFNPDVGDLVYVASATTVDDGSQNDYPVGIVVRVDPTVSTTAHCILICKQQFDAAAHA